MQATLVSAAGATAMFVASRATNYFSQAKLSGYYYDRQRNRNLEVAGVAAQIGISAGLGSYWLHKIGVFSLIGRGIVAVTNTMINRPTLTISIFGLAALLGINRLTARLSKGPNYLESYKEQQRREFFAVVGKVFQGVLGTGLGALWISKGDVLGRIGRRISGPKGPLFVTIAGVAALLTANRLTARFSKQSNRREEQERIGRIGKITQIGLGSMLGIYLLNKTGAFSLAKRALLAINASLPLFLTVAWMGIIGLSIYGKIQERRIRGALNNPPKYNKYNYNPKSYVKLDKNKVPYIPIPHNKPYLYEKAPVPTVLPPQIVASPQTLQVVLMQVQPNQEQLSEIIGQLADNEQLATVAITPELFAQPILLTMMVAAGASLGDSSQIEANLFHWFGQLTSEQWKNQNYREALRTALARPNALNFLGVMNDKAHYYQTPLVQALQNPTFLEFPNESPFDLMLNQRSAIAEGEKVYGNLGEQKSIPMTILDLSKEKMMKNPDLFVTTLERLAIVLEKVADPDDREGIAEIVDALVSEAGKMAPWLGPKRWERIDAAQQQIRKVCSVK